MYRPTVRYHDVYNEYVEKLFQSTNLDRNQIIRLGLFLLGHTDEGTKILEGCKKKDVTLPSPLWKDDDHDLWRKNSYVQREEGGTSSEIIDINSEYPPPVNQDRRPKRYTSNNQGGIKIYVK